MKSEINKFEELNNQQSFEYNGWLQGKFWYDCMKACKDNPDLFDKSIFTRKSFPKASDGYGKYIIWWSLKLNPEITEIMKDTKITHIHIKPYRIVESDTLEANVGNGVCFARALECNHNYNYINFDNISGNYHKLPNGQYQAVLCICGTCPLGPGFLKGEGKPITENRYYPMLSLNEGNKLKMGPEYVRTLVTGALDLIIKSYIDESILNEKQPKIISKIQQIIESQTTIANDEY